MVSPLFFWIWWEVGGKFENKNTPKNGGVGIEVGITRYNHQQKSNYYPHKKLHQVLQFGA